jgi:hypothetical protein
MPHVAVAVSLVVRRVPSKLRSIELQRQSNYSGGSDASALLAILDQVQSIPPCKSCPTPRLHRTI